MSLVFKVKKSLHPNPHILWRVFSGLVLGQRIISYLCDICPLKKFQLFPVVLHLNYHGTYCTLVQYSVSYLCDICPPKKLQLFPVVLHLHYHGTYYISYCTCVIFVLLISSSCSLLSSTSTTREQYHTCVIFVLLRSSSCSLLSSTSTTREKLAKQGEQ